MVSTIFISVMVSAIVSVVGTYLFWRPQLKKNKEARLAMSHELENKVVYLSDKRGFREYRK
jgi:predicted membrane protein